MDAVIGHDGGKSGWRLLILEDCDELIRGEAKQSAGQALSRLLNLTDDQSAERPAAGQYL
jgi:hypothetical protein